MNEPKLSTDRLRPILAEGRNCWAARPAASNGLLVDGRDYYRAFYEAAQQASRYILIAGWRFNSDVALLRGEDAPAGAEVRLLPFLNQLCERNPALQIFVLAWDFSLIYIREWEWFQRQKFERGNHQRLQFVFDSHHAVGGSHHQKFVVIDGVAAFVGGLDFNVDDWDDRRHLAFFTVRDGSGKGARPYHDIQGCFSGPAVNEVTEYFKLRWRKASGAELSLPESSVEQNISFQPTIPLTAPSVALSRNEPETLDDGNAVHEIRWLYVDAIAAADRLIYMENQYFSSQVVYQALVERMKATERSTLDIVVILPKYFPAWIETAAMGGPRLQMIDSLTEVARETGHRLAFYCVHAANQQGQDVAVLIHSKLMIIDDRFLTVGSCNTSNRSMGLDTELNISWEASTRSPETVDSIRRARINLLSEHLGLTEPKAFAALKGDCRLVEELDRLTGVAGIRLARLTPEVIVQGEAWVKTLADLGLSLDPSRPIVEETLFESME